MIRLQHVVTVFCTQVALVILIVIFWASNKGFEFTDEAYYILTLTQPDQSSSLFYYQYIFDALFGWMSPGLVGYRLIRLALTIVTSIFLGHSIFLFLKSKVQVFENAMLSKLSWTAISFIGLSVSYSIYPQCPSYNSLSVIILALILAIWIRIFFVGSKSVIWMIYLGMAITMLYFTKFTSAVIVLLVSLLGIIFRHFDNEEEKRSGLIFSLGYLLGGIASTFLVCGFLFHSMFSWFGGFQDALLSVEGHGISELLSRYKESANQTFTFFISKLVFYPLSIVVWINIQKKLFKEENRKLFGNMGFVLILVLASRCIYTFDLHLSGTQYLYSAFYLYIFLFSLAISPFFSHDIFQKLKSHFKPNIWKSYLLFLTFLIPIIGSLGTDNFLHVQMIQYAFALVILIAILSLISFQHVNKVYSVGLILMLVVFSSNQVYSGLVLKPYRIGATLHQQNASLRLPNGDQLKVDQNTKIASESFLGQLRNTEFEEGDPMLVLDGMPGFIYLANASVTGNSWNKNHQPRVTCLNLSNIGSLPMEKTVVLTSNANSVLDETKKCMKSTGINFPESYQNVGTAVNPVFRTQLEIYSPK